MALLTSKPYLPTKDDVKAWRYNFPQNPPHINKPNSPYPPEDVLRVRNRHLFSVYKKDYPGWDVVQYGRGEMSGTLSSSHFKLGPEPRDIKPAMQTTFNRDFPGWEVQFTPSAKPPKPAAVLGADLQFFNNKLSETRMQFNAHKHQPHDPVDPDKLRQTNFKMDRDDRIDTFNTTHNQDFVPHSITGQRRGAPKYDNRKSYIPQGDKEKAAEPMSDYRDRYRGHLCAKPELVTKSHGDNCLKGDNRQHNFLTSHVIDYKGEKMDRVRQLEPNRKQNIPMGDKEKDIVVLSEFQQAYKPHDIRGRSYDPQGAQRIRETTIKEKDDRLNRYVTEMVDQFVPKSGARRFSTMERNKSSVPRGDENLNRVKLDANCTTYDEYGPHGPTKIPDMVSGADKRTKSEVQFGDPEEMTKYYQTTMNDHFRSNEARKPPSSNLNNYKSSIPVDYYKDQNNSLYRDDFIDPDQGRMKVNEIAIEQVRASHIDPPLKQQRFFSTEHTEKYTPKTEGRPPPVDCYRLQRSTVPLGTFTQRGKDWCTMYTDVPNTPTKLQFDSK